MLLDSIKNKLFYQNKYKTHSEVVIIACYFNPLKSPYRKKAFSIWYESIKHLNHYILECVIGDNEPQLQEYKQIKTVYTPNMLWHKESLLNKIILDLPNKFKYVFWLDTDIIFTNKNWLIQGVEALKDNHIIQPFDFCVHLDKDETSPSFAIDELKKMELPNAKNNKVWRSFCANYFENQYWKDENYNNHGHVGFAWGAKREVLTQMPLYDKALIGGADHIIAHAAAGQIPHTCITKSFTDNLEEVNEWSSQFYAIVQGKIGYVKGDLFHLWHGDLEKRQYLKRIQEFTPKSKNITEKDDNGLYKTNKENDEYVTKYFAAREFSNETSTLNSINNSIFMTNNEIASNTEGFTEGFGGGDFSGGGAGADWGDSKDEKTDTFS